MSRHAIAMVVDRLLTDEGLRVRFAQDRIEAIAQLGLEGLELTPDEVDLFVRTDGHLWFWNDGVVGDLVH